MKSSTVEQTLAAGFAAILLMFGLLGGLIWYGATHAVQASDRVVQTQEMLTALGRLGSEIARAEAASHSYLVAGTGNYLSLRDKGFVGVEQALSLTERLLGDTPRHLDWLANIRRLVDKRIEVLLHYQRVRESEGLEAAAATFGIGLPITLQLHDSIEHLAALERQRLQAYRTDAEELRIITQWSLIVLAIALASVLAYLFLAVSRHNRLRQQANSALTRSEALLKQVLDLLPVAVFVADRHGTQTMSNPAAHALWADPPMDDGGIRRDAEYKGWRVADGTRIAADEWAMARAVQKGETIRNEEVEIECFNGERKIVLVSAVPLLDGQGRIHGGVAVCQNVTEMMRTQQHLRVAARFDETRAKALALFNAGFDRESMFKGLLALLAESHPFPVAAVYLHDEWRGKFVCEVAWGMPAQASREFAFGEDLPGQAAESGRTVRVQVDQDGFGLSLQAGIYDCAPTEILLVPVVYQDRCLAILAVASSRAVTEIESAFLEGLCVQLGIALNNLRLYGDTKLLAEQLRARSEEIARKNAELEAANRMKSEFLANMSHELRTPLNAIIGFSELLKNEVIGPLADDQREYVNDIFTSGQHLLSLINDILDLSKVESGAMHMHPEPVDLNRLCSNSVSIVRENAAAQGVALKVELAQDVASIEADGRRIKQIVYNLLSNAVKFSPEGGSVQLALRKVPRTEVERFASDWPARVFPLPAVPVQDFLEICVSDEGIGIPQSGLERLFQPFVQIDSGLSRNFEGTGLGLTMVKRLAELHGGTVGVTSEPGRGTRFYVWLPMCPARIELEGGPAFDRADPLPAAASRPCALVIEDDDRAAELIRLQLEPEGLQVIRAADGEQALRIALQQPLALITLDILLPGMDGWEVLARLKQMPELAHVPVVIISIVAESNRGTSLGAAAVIEKPVSRAALHRAVAALGLDALPGRAARVLVVDDDPRAVEIIAAHLPEPDFTVMRAYGGREAIAAAHQLLPDLIVLDLMMPEVSGFDVVEDLKGDPATLPIPILIVTAKNVSTEDRKQLKGQVSRIMGKSDFNHGRFIGEVRRALHARSRPR